MTVFGQILDAADVERALLDHLERWMPTYIAEVLRQKDPESTTWPAGVAEIRAYTVTHFAAEKWPEDQLPMLIAHSPGMADEPQTAGDGKVSGRYAVLLLAIASGVDMADSKALARLYGKAAQMAIMQHPGLSGFAEGVAMGREENYPVTRGVEAERSLMAVACPYVVEIADILDTTGGPLEPLKDPSVPPADWPTVKEGGGSASAILEDAAWFEEHEPEVPGD